MTQFILLNGDGSVKCRKPLPSIVDQNTIKGDGEGTKFALDMNAVASALDGDGTRANAGHIDADLVVDAPLSGAGRSDSHLKVATATADAVGVVELTGAAQIPAEANRDDDAITPAGVSKLLKGIKPVGSTGGASAEQNAHGIEVPMLHNVSCTGGTRGSPTFTIPMAGGGQCVVDVGAWGSNDQGTIPAGTVVGAGILGCFRLPEKGLYRITWDFDPSESIMYVYNAGYSAAQPSPCLPIFTKDEAGCNPSYADLNGIGSIGNCSSMSITYNGSVDGTHVNQMTFFTGYQFTVAKA